MRFGGQLFCSRTNLIHPFFSGQRTPVFKKVELASFWDLRLEYRPDGIEAFCGVF
jgi:hypothetical protein